MLSLMVGVAVATLLGAAGDPVKGKKAFEKCAACHSFEESKAAGPTLKGVFGRKAGSLEDYRYSAAMARSDIVWDRTTMDRFITDSQAYLKGNRMAFAGMGDGSERDDLLAYIEQMAKPPEQARDLPER